MVKINRLNKTVKFTAANSIFGILKIHHYSFLRSCAGITAFLAFCAVCGFAQTTVEVSPGDDIQALIDANDGNTRFLFKAGKHRMQTFTPKTGNILEGEDGAIISGARLLTEWVQESGYWVHYGQTQQGDQTNTGHCLGTDLICRFDENIYIDDGILGHVINLSEVRPGRFYFDYAADKVYMVEDPTGRTVEIGVTDKGILGGASDLIIRNLIVEKYATALINRGAVSVTGTNCLVENCEFRYNHKVGLSVGGSGNTVRNCYLHHQGQTGIHMGGTNNLLENNEMAFNSVPEIELDGYWWGSSCKFAQSNGIIVRGNYSHDNLGPGLWTDIDNYGALYEGNLVENNSCQGIFHEISFNAVIRCNIVRNNGYDPRMWDWVWGGQIQMANSDEVEVSNNIIEVHPAFGNAITISNQDRGSTHYSRNNTVHDNIVTFLGVHGLMGADADFDQAAFWTSSNNVFENNQYHVADVSYYYWIFAEPGFSGDLAPMHTFDQWKAFGHDAAATIDSDIRERQAPEGCVAAPAADGPRDSIRLVAQDTIIMENNNSGLMVTVSRSGNIAGTLDIQLYIGGSAVPVQDYEPVSGSLTLPAGASSATLLFKPVNNNVLEEREEIVVTVTRTDTYMPVWNYGIAHFIIEDDDRPRFGRAEMPVVVDGVEENTWDSASVYTLDNLLRGSRESDSDLSAQFKASWDENALYVLAEVYDQTIITDSDDRPYNDDGVEVFIDAGNERASSYDDNDFQFVFRPGSTSIATYKNRLLQTTPDGVVFAKTDLEGGYLIEAAFPWSALDMSTTPQDRIGFEIHADDDDDGGSYDTKLSWKSGTSEANRRPWLFQAVDLVEDVSKIGMMSGSQDMNLISGVARYHASERRIVVPLRGNTAHPLTINVYDQSGRRVRSRTAGASGNTAYIDVSGMAGGVYHVEVLGAHMQYHAPVAVY